MPNSLTIQFDDIDAFIFDFDGVLTNDLVYVDQNGIETVCCSRADGLAFDVLKKLEKSVYILSTEKNSVVTARASKLNIEALQGVDDKAEKIKQLTKEKKINLKNILYVGNDLNDFLAMNLCGYSACPSDSHNLIKENSDIILKKKGGNGIVRELIEEVFKLDIIKILYTKN